MNNNPSDGPSIISIGLVSGINYHVKSLFLCSQIAIHSARNLQAIATKNLGGVSSGLGFIGDPSWVIGSSVGLSLLEGLVSKAVAKEGVKQFEQATQQMNEARKNGGFIAVSEIWNSDQPFPAKWAHRQNVERAALKGFITKTESVTEVMIHSGDPFIYVRTIEEESMFLAWDKVETYLPIWEEINRP